MLTNDNQMKCLSIVLPLVPIFLGPDECRSELLWSCGTFVISKKHFQFQVFVGCQLQIEYFYKCRLNLLFKLRLMKCQVSKSETVGTLSFSCRLLGPVMPPDKNV